MLFEEWASENLKHRYLSLLERIKEKELADKCTIPFVPYRFRQDQRPGEHFGRQAGKALGGVDYLPGVVFHVGHEASAWGDLHIFTERNGRQIATGTPKTPQISPITGRTRTS